MKIPVYFDRMFYPEYTDDPAAEAGRMEAITREIESVCRFQPVSPADPEDLAAVHGQSHIADVRSEGLYNIAALAAGAAIQTAQHGLRQPAFGLIRPPGHHASKDDAWGFCYFNNMAVALTALKRANKIRRAAVLDIDLHFGDGTVNLLGDSGWVDILNPPERDRDHYIRNTSDWLSGLNVDIIGVSAGFDHHRDDWGGLLETEDYQAIGHLVRQTARRLNAGCFGLLEGGYNHDVLGTNTRALLAGFMEG